MAFLLNFMFYNISKNHTSYLYLYDQYVIQLHRLITRLKSKIKSNSTSEAAFYHFFHFKCDAANASELFKMTHLANIEGFLYHSYLSF